MCVRLEASRLLTGLSGVKAVPTTLMIKAPEAFLARGAIRNWDLVRKAWQRGFSSAVLTQGNPKGVIIALPSICTQAEVERIVDAMFVEFPVTSVFLVNPWLAVMVNAGRRKGVVVFIEETAVAVVCVVNLRLEPASVHLLQQGMRDYVDPSTHGPGRFVKNLQAVRASVPSALFTPRRPSTQPSCTARRTTGRSCC